MPQTDPFPASDFDPWAESYDKDVQSFKIFPFDGYEKVLKTVVDLAAPRTGMIVLDLGTGTGNLAIPFAEAGCELWCTDFSQTMLDKALEKLPQAHFLLHDIRTAWPPELDRRFDRIVSAYVFHHLELDGKVKFCKELVTNRLAPDGKLIVADLSFPSEKSMRDFAQSIGDLWEQEPYWLADESIPALQKANLKVEYVQVSKCAGVYEMSVSP
jgi:putative AdoMet-dependent methyltransferase